MSEQTEEGQINKWVDICLIDQDIENYEVEPPKYSEKGEGYSTKVLFVKVNGTRKSNGENVELDLVFKVSRVFKGTQNVNMKIAYEKEMAVYDKVFPLLKEFAKGKKASEVFNSVPKCLKTLRVDDREIVVLMNLRKYGYIPHDRLSPMNFNHIKHVLRNYAKFHAITYAYRDQKPTEFYKHFHDYTNVYNFFVNAEFRGLFQKKFIKARDQIKQVDGELAKKMDGIIEKGAPEILDELFDQHVELSTITHGDCWNSNFLFKYENGDTKSPTNAIILDWQMSSLHSPVLDLSYFLFAVSSTEQVAKLEELLKYYYDHLSDAIKDLGSDPDKVFTFSQFYEQWKKYCLAGLIITVGFLDTLLSDKEDVIEFDELSNFEEIMNAFTEGSNRENKGYLERIRAIVGYYFKLVEK